MTMGFTRGMRGSRGWMIAGIVSIGLRALRRLHNPPEKVLYRSAIKPGDAFEIVARPQLSRKQRRAAQ